MYFISTLVKGEGIFASFLEKMFIVHHSNIA